MEPSELQQHIIAFIAEIESCAKSTSFANDRPVCFRDIATAASWLVKIHRGISTVHVIDEINSPQTDKTFGDYWRQGEWGEREMKALKKTSRRHQRQLLTPYKSAVM